MSLPPVPYQTDFQDKTTTRITQPWLQWLEQLRSTLNRLTTGQGTLLHDELTDVSTDQHHAEVHTHLNGDSGAVSHVELTNVTINQHHDKSHVHLNDGSGTVDYNSLSSLPTIPTQTPLRDLWALKQWYAARAVNVGSDVSGVSGSTLLSTIGCTAAFSSSAASAFSTWDAVNPYGILFTSTTIQDHVFFQTYMGSSQGAGAWIALHNPYVQFGIKTGASVADITLFIGSLADPNGTSPTSAQEALPSSYGSWPNFIGFRFLASGGTGTWDVIHRTTTATATITSTAVTVSANTAYKFEIETVDLGVTWTFKINGVLVATKTSNLPDTNPATAPSMQEIVWVRNKVGGVGSSKTIKFRSIYAEYGGDISQTS
jgi:hypothetical protein